MNNKSGNFHVVYLCIIAALLLVIGGGLYYFNKKVSAVSKIMASTKKPEPSPKMRMAMTPQKPPTASNQQAQQLVLGVSTSTKQKIFNITGGNFYFVPNKITVNKGDEVTFVVTNAGGIHDLHIDELGVNTPVVKSGEAAMATFTASKSGSFVYYCALPEHREKGMWGTLVVQ